MKPHADTVAILQVQLLNCPVAFTGYKSRHHAERYLVFGIAETACHPIDKHH